MNYPKDQFDCTDVRGVLSGLLDGELDERTQRLADAHLASCAPCRAVLQEMEELDLRTRAALEAGEVWPTALERRVLAAVGARGDGRPQRYRLLAVAAWTGWGSALAACAALAFVMSRPGGRTDDPGYYAINSSATSRSEPVLAPPAAAQSATSLGVEESEFQPTPTDMTEAGLSSMDEASRSGFGPADSAGGGTTPVNDDESARFASSGVQMRSGGFAPIGDSDFPTGPASSDRPRIVRMSYELPASTMPPEVTYAMRSLRNRPVVGIGVIERTPERVTAKASEPWPSAAGSLPSDLFVSAERDSSAGRTIDDSGSASPIDRGDHIYHAAVLLDVLRQLDVSESYRDVHMVSNVIDRDDLLDRLTEARRQVNPKDADAINRAWTILEMVNGPIDSRRLGLLQEEIDESQLIARLEDLSERLAH